MFLFVNAIIILLLRLASWKENGGVMAFEAAVVSSFQAFHHARVVTVTADDTPANGRHVSSSSRSTCLMLSSASPDPSFWSSSSSKLDNTTDDNNNAASSRSIGDVVQGLHGSKYQFQQPSSSIISFEGQQFAETGYSSGNYQGDASAIEASMKQEPLPRWAIQWQQTFVPQQQQQQQQVVELEVLSLAPQTLSIQNQERSWEKFYTFVLLREGDDARTCCMDASYLVPVTPKMGMLAPRGNHQGRKDGTFADTAQLQVTLKINDPDAAGKLWLLVGTEAEKWVYKLI
jgi:hypothetical protein